MTLVVMEGVPLVSLDLQGPRRDFPECQSSFYVVRVCIDVTFFLTLLLGTPDLSVSL